ncbi:MAG: 1-deoxy-D-xylulose-5-phosphate synthase [Bacteroidales bacterium]|jgi:1-deoxy-D-xylulose-5-phosphate synthase|nr:1-deoxy-D-xylulose-5-phosphate synthase [Bacteroidales bacterium]
MSTLLDTIFSPADLKKIDPSQLPQLCKELRDFIIVTSANNPGHLGASLGTVELAVALHYVFDAPKDKIVWDVGHQAYAHKILTGRKDRFKDNRKYKGISGFPNIEESEYDAFGTGHSSTSISAVLGMAISAAMQGKNERNHIAVIGDGSIGGGMAFEAMNHAGTTDANMLIVLNDNKIAIDKNVGAVSENLLAITSSAGYNRFKNRLWNFLTSNSNKANAFTRFFSATGNVIKGLILSGSNIFQSLGFRYFGPSDGHDVVRLVQIFNSLKNIKGPKILHLITIKGKGMSVAEDNQITYHAPGKYNPDTGEIIEISHEGEPPKYQDVFGATLLELAQLNEKIVAITPAMLTGSSLNMMKEVFPKRVFDVGIAEQHAVTFAAGFAIEGMIPFCNIYSSFLQRGYDQLIHDVALQKLPVIFAVDRGGLVGEDGATHHGIFDLAYLNAVPNMIVASPINEIEFRNMLYTAYLNRKNPFAIRYPRGKGVIANWQIPFHTLEIGKAEVINHGSQIAVLSIGPLGNHVQKAIQNLHKEGVFPAHVNMRFLKPLDELLLKEIAQQYPTLLTVEDGTEKGGLFSTVAEFLEKNLLKNNLHNISIPDQFIEHGDLLNLYHQVGFDVKSIEDKIKNYNICSVISGRL